LVVIFTTTSCTSTIAVRPANATIVKVAPKHHKIVVVKGNRYYYWNGKHYKERICLCRSKVKPK
jgi:uncharacterized protein with PIN domain